MKQGLIILVILLPFLGFGQKFGIDSLISLQNEYRIANNYDSFIWACRQIKSTDRRIARERQIDYQIADAFYKKKDYGNAVKYSKRFLRKFTIVRLNRISYTRNIRKRELCYNLSEIYKEQNNYSGAVKYLEKIERKYDNFTCGVGVVSWRIGLCEDIIECYAKLDNQRKIDIYKKKIAQLENKSE